MLPFLWQAAQPARYSVVLRSLQQCRAKHTITMKKNLITTKNTKTKKMKNTMRKTEPKK